MLSHYVVGTHLRTSNVFSNRSVTILLTNDHDKLIRTTFNAYTAGKLISLNKLLKSFCVCLDKISIIYSVQIT